MKLTEELLESIGEEVDDELDLVAESYGFEMNGVISPRIIERGIKHSTIEVTFDYTTTDDGIRHDGTIYTMEDFPDDRIFELKDLMTEGIISCIRPDEEFGDGYNAEDDEY